MDGLLQQALIFLAAGVIAVPIAKRLGLGSVLGYLLAGVLIGPALHLVETGEASALQEFAGFGVVMMLFIIGLELDPKKLWAMRGQLFGLGGLQILGTTAVIAAAMLAIGLPWREALALGVILAMSSTAIVLQTLGEKGWMNTDGGRASFSVLLMQDIAVIPILAILPLLAVGGIPHDGAAAASAHGHGAGAWTVGLPPWAQGLVIIGAIAFVIFAGRFLTRPLFRFIARAHLSEIFTAAALLLVVAISYLMTMVGLSPALGAFVAGVVLADSEFRHELVSDIDPFKGLLLGLFFITVGAGIEFELLTSQPFLIAGLALALVLVKFAVLFVLAQPFKVGGRDRWMLAMGLAQGGEFAFVLLGLAGGLGAISDQSSGIASLVVAISMAIAPLLTVLFERVIAPWTESSRNRRADDIVDEHGQVIIAGVGRFGQIVQRMLSSQGYATVVIDHDDEMVDAVARFGTKVFYGDASRPAMLHAAGIDEAKLFVVAIDQREASLRAVEHVKREHPHVKVIARAFDRLHYYELSDAGADVVVRELFEGSLDAARQSLVLLGVDPLIAERAASVFRDHDSQTLDELAKLWEKGADPTANPSYVALSKARAAMLADALQLDQTARVEKDRA
jgi:CPA2 family monovalent cation:H+ antiporter-2/glutathione-regulated potassium-efflux system ancillary protein KefC